MNIERNKISVKSNREHDMTKYNVKIKRLTPETEIILEVGIEYKILTCILNWSDMHFIHCKRVLRIKHFQPNQNFIGTLLLSGGVECTPSTVPAIGSDGRAADESRGALHRDAEASRVRGEQEAV